MSASHTGEAVEPPFPAGLLAAGAACAAAAGAPGLSCLSCLSWALPVIVNSMTAPTSPARPKRTGLGEVAWRVVTADGRCVLGPVLSCYSPICSLTTSTCEHLPLQTSQPSPNIRPVCASSHDCAARVA